MTPARALRGAAIALALSLGIWIALLLAGRGSGREEPIPVMATIGAFELIDQEGMPFSSSELEGKVWIAGFFFTQCPSVCPTLTAAMANLQRRLAPHGDAVRMVSISVDPEHDTPERLRAYAALHRADLATWTFLTGEPVEVRATLTRSFLVPVGERTEVAGDRYDILHTARLMLVDRQRRMRGLYSTDAEGLSELERDVQRLLDE